MDCSALDPHMGRIDKFDPSYKIPDLNPVTKTEIPLKIINVM